jgi:hypothetical protein
MPRPCRRLVSLTAVLALFASANAAASAEPGWTDVPLPGGRAGLLPRIGLAADVPRALALGEIVRVAHASRDPDAAVAQMLADYFAAPPQGSELVPVPLTLTEWRALLGDEITDRTLIARLVGDRRAALLCFGLLQLDPETRGVVGSDAALMRRLYERHSGIFAAFAQALHVRDGAIALPGGESARAAWTSVLEDAIGDPPRAILRLVETENGRLLYFLDTVSRLDALRQALVLTDRPDDEVGDRLRSVYRTFTRIEPGWQLGEFPFVRLGADPALVLAGMQPDNGALRHTQAFWQVVWGDTTLVKDHRKRWANLDAGDRVEPAWLLDRITDAALPQRLERLQIQAFAERTTDRLPGAHVADVALLARAFRRYPALLLTLERLGVDDVDVLVRLVNHASRLRAVSGDVARHEQTLALFQAPLMLLVRAQQVKAIPAATARALVSSFSRLVPSETAYGRAVGVWIETELLPALGYDAAIEGASAEVSLLEALAGLRTPVTEGGAPTVTWEARTYRIDLAAPELVRLTEVRGLQEGNTLDTALAAARIGASISGKDAVTAAATVSTALRTLAAAVEPIEVSERTTASPPLDARAVIIAAADDLARLRARPDARRVTDIAARLGSAEDALLADVLTSLLYALWIGDPQGQAFLAGNVARRHDFGLRLMTASERADTPWLLPLETSGSGEPWHLRGALLGLDVGLSRLALRRTRLDLPDNQPTLNESDRRTLVMTLALTNPYEIDQPSATRLIGWMREGRAILNSPSRLEERLDRLSLDGRRRESIRWAARHATEEIESLLLRTELVLLGRDQRTPLPDVWGQADTARSGCLCLEFPDPPAIDRVVGRAGTGLVMARIADLKLRVLEMLDDLKLPAVLAPGVLASALQDYLDDVRPAYGDDWLALARHVDRLQQERFDDYVAALTAGGPLVPTAAAPTSTNGQE